MKQKLFSRDFTLVVIGQIISLFGNAAIRFALPLYLLNQTGSPALYGTVTACAFIPAVLISPVGGIAADRVNKRNVMVILDFFTAAVILAFSLLMDGPSLVLLLTVTLMLLYGIAGAYQPSVQASIPALVSQENLVAGNSVINIISSFASLLGPVLGGLLYSTYGLEPVLWVCMVCFFLSAVMEIFIHIPFVKQETSESIWKTAKSDLADGIRFILREKPIIGKGTLVVCGLTLFSSSMIIVGTPYLITEVLGFDEALANRLYGFTQGALAAGGIAGGIAAGVLGNRLDIRKIGTVLAAFTLCLFPIGASLLLSPSGMVTYVIITVCCFACMVCSTIINVQMMAFVQEETPNTLIGKVISIIITAGTCSQPLGSAIYGLLFEVCGGFEYAVVLFSAVVSLLIAVGTRNIFKEIPAKVQGETL